MRLLLDTHAFVWWLGRSARLPAGVRATLSEGAHDLHLSAATVWEMAIKVKKGNFPAAAELLDRLDVMVGRYHVAAVPVTHDHGIRAGGLHRHHGDPFDRMLVAQAELEKFSIVSADKIFDRYGIERIW